MSKTFLERGQIVGYDFEQKRLIVTLSEKMARKMKSDGWEPVYDKQVGWIISVQLQA